MIGYGRLSRSLPSLPGLTRQSITFARFSRRGWMPGSSPGTTSSVLRLFCLISGEDAHDVALLHDQELLAVELDLGARPLAEQHAVADLEVDRDQLAGFVTAARTDRRDFALRGLFLGAVRNDDAASCLFFGVDALDHNAVVKRTEFHAVLLSF